MPSSTGTLVFNDQKIQAPDIYATESLGVGVSDPTSNLEVVGNAYVSSNLQVGTADLFVDTTTGRVGVGVAHPTSRFEVAGADGLQEYPPKAMTDFETYIAGHGVFRASASSDSGTNFEAWQAFNKFITKTSPYIYRWRSDDNIYTSSLANTTTGSARLSEYTPYGTYLILELPYKICLKTYVWIGMTTQIPREGQIWGSNDGMSWSLVDAFTDGGAGWVAAGSSITDYNEYPDTREITGNTAYYSQYAFIITRNRGDDATSIRELHYYGTPAPSSLEDGHLTLGKALTAPRLSGHGAGAETPRAESLVVHYDTTVDSVVSGSTVVDISGQGNNGTLNGNASYFLTDRAFTFDGSGDRITTTAPFSAGDNTFSVSLWVKRNANGGIYCPIYIGDAATGQGIGMDIYTDGKVYWFVYSGKNFLWSGVSGTWFPVGSWTHVVASHTTGSDFANLNKVWINGVEMSGSATFGGTSDLSLDANDGVTLGARVNNNYLNGQISNFKLWGGVALTAEEVAQEYALGRTGKSLNLTDTSLCLGGTVPRAQLDVRGSAVFGGDIKIYGNMTYYIDPFKLDRSVLNSLSPTVWAVAGESTARVGGGAISYSGQVTIEYLNGTPMWYMRGRDENVDILNTISSTTNTWTIAIAIAKKPQSFGVLFTQLPSGENSSTNHIINWIGNITGDEFSPSGNGWDIGNPVSIPDESVLVVRKNGTGTNGVTVWLNGGIHGTATSPETYNGTTSNRIRLGQRGRYAGYGNQTPLHIGFAAVAAWDSALTNNQVADYLNYQSITAY